MGKLGADQRRRFARAYLKTMDPEAVAKAARVLNPGRF